mmetsp:Transcript_144321/g.269027  ORF Transcript_144321/g.269027 Transcript_144321/m.269027 type:complete len:209 (+) Transcript_144321:539-1165(+)
MGLLFTSLCKLLCFCFCKLRRLLRLCLQVFQAHSSQRRTLLLQLLQALAETRILGKLLRLGLCRAHCVTGLSLRSLTEHQSFLFRLRQKLHRPSPGTLYRCRPILLIEVLCHNSKNSHLIHHPSQFLCVDLRKLIRRSMKMGTLGNHLEADLCLTQSAVKLCLLCCKLFPLFSELVNLAVEDVQLKCSHVRFVPQKQSANQEAQDGHA